MDTLYLLEPEVAGGWGPRTIVSNRSELANNPKTIPEISRLEYKLEGWMGDHLLESFPCYIVSTPLAEAIKQAGLSGVSFDSVEITFSDQFVKFKDQMLSGAKLPDFQRLLPNGTAEYNSDGDVINWSEDDICWGSCVGSNAGTTPAQIMAGLPVSGLVVSKRALELLQKFPLENCDITSLNK